MDDVPPEIPPLHEDLAFLSPLSPARADRLVAWLAAGLADGGTVLDVGCGWGELLLRVAEAAPSAYATGVDVDDEALDEGRRRAQARGLEPRVSFVRGPGATAGPTGVDALIAVGVSQVWGPEVDEQQPLAYAEALAAIRRRVRRGARVLYGEAIWSRPPTPAATAPLAGRDDEFVSLAVLAQTAAGAGFSVAGLGEASQEEWDALESGFGAGWARWLAHAEPDDPDVEAVRARAERQRAAYLEGYRGVLGMAYLQLLAC